MSLTVADHVIQATRSGVPLIGLSTHDPTEWLQQLREQDRWGETPCAHLIMWDIVRGFSGYGGDSEAEFWASSRGAKTANVGALIKELDAVPTESLVVVQNAHLFLSSPGVKQGLLNIRDQYSFSGRTVILCAPHFIAPLELRHDIIVFEHLLPTEEELATSLAQRSWLQVGCADPLSLDRVQVTHLARRMRGMGHFEAEQVTSMAVSAQDGHLAVDRDLIIEHSRAMIEACRGIKLHRTPETFNDIAGLDELKRIGSQLFRQDQAAPIRVVVFIDEFEKMMAGSDDQAASDNTGVAQGFNMRLLVELEQRRYRGLILFGPPGTGKSLYAQSLGNTYGIPTILLNLKAMLQKELGESEQNLEAALRVIFSLAGPQGALFIAAVNSQVNISPEMRRRFGLGIYMVDLPGPPQRTQLWAIHQKQFDIPPQDLPQDEDWSGSDIRNCCDLANMLGISLREAAEKIVPTKVSDPEVITLLRTSANNRYLSSEVPGRYLMGGRAKTRKGREIR